MKQLSRMLKKLNEIHIFPWLSVNIWFIPVAVCSILGGYSHLFFCAFLIALLHELAHIFCAKLLNVKITKITVFPFGVAAVLSGGYIKRSEKEFLIAFSGPFSNIIMFWISTLLTKYFHFPIIGYCADVNLAMCAINLIPALPLDGGRMFKSILTSKFGILRAYNFVIKLSRIIIVLLALFAALLFFLTDFNFSLILISVFLFQNLSREQLSVSHIALKEILENHQKVQGREFFPAKVFCIDVNSRISVILRLLSHDYYCIIHVTDKSSEIIKTVTETELLSVLTQKGIRTKFSEI